MITKLTTAVLFSLVASCGQWMQLEHVCDLDVDGICVSIGDTDVTGERISEAIDIAYHRYSLQYGVSFNTRRTAEDSGLYLAWRSREFLDSWCSHEAAACYFGMTEEIVVASAKNDSNTIAALCQSEMFASLAHEMMHFWNNAILRHRQPELFWPSFHWVEENHTAPHMFSIWCDEYGGEGCVEDAVRSDILSSPCLLLGDAATAG